MEIQKNEEASEQMEAAVHTAKHIFSYINSMSLKCAVELRIPDIIVKHGKPMALSDLIRALPINAAKSQSIYRLMRILTHSGFFLTEKTPENDQEESFVVTPSGMLLVRDQLLSLSPLLLSELDPMMTSPFHHLSEWMQNGDPSPFFTAHGTSVWEKAGQDARLNNLFNEAMASDARLAKSLLTKEYAALFEGVGSIVDVGGGTGTIGKAIADAFPHIKCTVLDLPHVIDGLEGTGNLTFVSGDMFEAVPSADAVLLKLILHDWGDEECLKILKSCKEAISNKKKGGKVIIMDIVLDNKKGSPETNEFHLLCDMLMMAHCDGKERTEKEWAKLFAEVGFSDYKIHYQALGMRSIIELFY